MGFIFATLQAFQKTSLETDRLQSAENGFAKTTLTHFWPMFPFYTPLKYQKTKTFLVFSWGIKLEHWSVVYIKNLD